MELDFHSLMIQPMRDELTQIGFTELKTAEAVDTALSRSGTTLLVVNSVCGCAGGLARPGVALALQNSAVPDYKVTVFAGQDKDATVRAREYLVGQPPSSPSVWLLRDGQLVGMLHRNEIEGTSAREVADRLVTMFNEHCTNSLQ